MMTFEWNALRPGDRVAVHDDDVSVSLSSGVVSIVQTRPDGNQIAVRLDDPRAGPEVVRPRRLAVHTLPLDPNESCWRCDAIAVLAGSTPSAKGLVDAQ